MNGISLFANVGIDEFYLKDIGLNIKVSNELLNERCQFYKHIYPDVDMVCGDIRDENIFNKLLQKYKENNCEFLLATPPCQGMSMAGKMDKDDIRNKLIVEVVNFIKIVLPKNVIIENVPQILDFSINIDDKIIKIVDFIKQELEPIGYFINYDVLNAADYGTPQHRKRAIFLISKIKKWQFPAKKTQITVRQAIGDLPSLESGQKYDIKYHEAKIHNQNHIFWMKNTPTGKTALDNPVHFPQKNNRTLNEKDNLMREILI